MNKVERYEMSYSVFSSHILSVYPNLNEYTARGPDSNHQTFYYTEVILDELGLILVLV